MKKLLPCHVCQIDTVQSVIAPGVSICWCGAENHFEATDTTPIQEADIIRCEGTAE